MISFRVGVGGQNDSVLHYSVNVYGIRPACRGGESACTADGVIELEFTEAHPCHHECWRSYADDGNVCEWRGVMMRRADYNLARMSGMLDLLCGTGQIIVG